MSFLPEASERDKLRHVRGRASDLANQPGNRRKRAVLRDALFQNAAQIPGGCDFEHDHPDVKVIGLASPYEATNPANEMATDRDMTQKAPNTSGVASGPSASRAARFGPAARFTVSTNSILPRCRDSIQNIEPLAEIRPKASPRRLRRFRPIVKNG
jgi:hypothetical protein